jgi:iron(III) transport system permease protein
MERANKSKTTSRIRASSLLRPEITLYGVGWLAAAVVVLLVLIIFWSMFQSGLPSINRLLKFSLDNFRSVFSSPKYFLKAAFNTLELGVGATVVTLLFGIPAAWLIHRTDLWGRNFFKNLMFLNTLLPGFIKIIGWIILLGPQVGLVNQIIRAVLPHITTGPFTPYSIGFMAFLEGISAVPLFFLTIGNAFSSIDPSLEEAGEASGMNKLQVFWRITLPIVKPAILTGTILVFVMTISMFEVPALLGATSRMNFLSTIMYDSLSPHVGMPEYGVAGIYAMMMLVPTLIALFFYQRMLNVSHRYTTVTGKGYRSKTTKLGRWKWPGMIFILIFFLLNLVLPFLVVIWTSLTPSIQLPSLSAMKNVSLVAYEHAFDILLGQNAILNTVIIVVVVGVAGTLLGLVISWIVTRTRMRGRYVLDTIAMIPHVVPAIGIAFAVAFLGLVLVNKIPLYGSLAAIIIAGIVRALPFCTRNMNSSLLQLHPELEEAVQTSGASKVVALKKIAMPLISPAIAYSFIWTVLQASKDVTVPLFLMSPKTMTISTAIWIQWKGVDSNVAYAQSVIMILFMAIVVSILMKAIPKTVRKGMQ